jgi:UrcA family protein
MHRYALAGLICASVVGAAVLGVGVALAQPIETQSVHVSYADLNLRSPEGAQVMYRRIKEAAAIACGNEPDVRELDRHAAFERCRTQSIQHAADRLGAPMVTALAGSTGATVVLAGR